jgi:hypothetical protein
MKSSQAFALLTSALGVLTVNLAVSQPASAAIVCEPKTSLNYTNGSLAACILSENTTVEISTPSAGTSSFPCKEKNWITFNDQGQLSSCRLWEEINIRQGNSVEKCPVDYRVELTINKEIPSIRCTFY